MNKNTALLFLFAVLLIASYRYFLSLLFFIAVLASFIRRCASLLFLVAILASLPSRCILSLLSSRCSHYFSLAVRRYFLVALFICRCSRCSTSFLLFTLVVTLSTHYSHCLLCRHYFSLFSFNNF